MAVLLLRGGIGLRFLIQHRKARETHHRAGGAKRIRRRFHVNPRLVDDRGAHLAGHQPVPDQPIKGKLLGGQVRLETVRRTQHRRGPDRLVRFLRSLLLAVLARLGHHVILTVMLGDVGLRFLYSVISQPRRIGPHVGDQAGLAVVADGQALVEPLRHPHGALGGEAQLANRLLAAGCWW